MNKPDFFDSLRINVREEAREAAREEIQKFLRETRENEPIHTEPQRKLLTNREVSEKLGVTTMTLLRWRNAGDLVGIHIGGRVYYEPAVIDSLIQQGRRA